jgi:hypothetical protein
MELVKVVAAVGVGTASTFIGQRSKWTRTAWDTSRVISAPADADEDQLRANGPRVFPEPWPAVSTHGRRTRRNSRATLRAVVPMRSVKMLSSRLVATLALAIPGSAAASEHASPHDPQHAFEYPATPSTLYIPIESIPLVPASQCPFPQGGADNSALGCVGGLADAEDYEPPANPMMVVDGLLQRCIPRWLSRDGSRGE